MAILERIKFAVMDFVVDFKQWRCLMKEQDPDAIEIERSFFFSWIGSSLFYE